MKGINVLGALISLGCAIYVSFNHTLDLYRSGGYTGKLAYAAAIGVEVVFVVGTLNLIIETLNGRPLTWPIIAASALGISVVTWSNVAAGWQYGVTGILLGISTPISVWVAKAMLSKVLADQSNDQAADHRQVEVADQVADPAGVATPDRPTGQADGDSRVKVADQPADRVAETAAPGQVASQVADHRQAMADGQATSHAAEPARATADKVADGRPANVVEMAEWSAGRRPRTNDRPTGQAEVADHHADQPGGRTDSQPTNQAAGQPATETTDRPETKQTGQSSNQPPPIEVLVKAAEEHYKKKGQMPTIRGLARDWNVSRHRASRAIDIAKEKILTV